MDALQRYKRMGVVLEEEQLREIVRAVKKSRRFVFDVETRGVLERHEYLRPFIVGEHRERVGNLLSCSPKKSAEVLEKVESEYREMLALDPTRNEVFWIGISVAGRSWAIPMGHKRGRLLTPEEIGDGSTVPPEGHRLILKDGTESMAKRRYRIPATFAPAPVQLSRATVLGHLEEIFYDSTIERINQNVKFDIRSLQKYYSGAAMPGPLGELMVAQHVQDENALHQMDLTSIIKHNFGGYNPYADDGKLGKTIDFVDFDSAARYVIHDVRWTWLTYMKLRRQMRRMEYDAYYCKDMEVLEALIAMEDAGVYIDTEAIAEVGDSLHHDIEEIKRQIEGYAGAGFNPASNPQKQQLLYGPKSEGGLGLKVPKYTGKDHDNPSVDKEALDMLVDAHPVVPLIQKFQELDKLYGTYIVGLSHRLYRGRLNPSFNLHRTVTGRLSGSEPNVQNIPKETDEADVRRLFIAPPGYVLVVADYDQIELRVIAMECKDKEMMYIFEHDIDVHAGAAAQIYDKPVEEVTPKERDVGKTSNFLVGYGGGAQRLAARAGIRVSVAEGIIVVYYERFSGIKPWKRKVVVGCRRNGYVTTMHGRRRRLPDITSDNERLRARAERQAVNAVVQGTAADICKDAIIAVHRRYEKDPEVNLLMQVHDELIVSCPQERADEVKEEVMRLMGHGKVLMGVPLRVSCGVGRSWAEAKGK